MPAVAPYIPPRDADLDAWATNFTTLITSSPFTYGLTPADATAIAAAVLPWSVAFILISSPTTKTAAVVAQKNTAKVNMLNTIRPYAQNISLNPGVSSANKIALGLNPRTSTPSPITPPASNPILSWISGSNLAAILRYRDSAASPSVKSKPYGVIACQIFGMTSSTPVTDPAVLPWYASSTKSPALLTFPGGSAGLIFYAAARWLIRTGPFSPWSPIIHFTIPLAG